MIKRVLVSIAIAAAALGCKREQSSNAPQARPGVAAREVNEPDHLATARSLFQTHLIDPGPSPQPYEEGTPPADAKVVKYTSGSLTLRAWISTDAVKGSSRPRPAVVWLHGGFAFGADDWKEAKPYRDAGFLVMAPMLRGENGNPGNHEMFYGEVDDAIAAGRFLASLPGIDAAHIFVAGHSSGGAEALLVALLPSPFAASTPIGGYVDMADVAQYMTDRKIPFDTENPREFTLRSAMHFPKSVKIPLYLLCGDEDVIAEHGTKEFAAAVRATGQKCQVISIRGDHFTSEPKAIERSIQIFKSFLAK